MLLSEDGWFFFLSHAPTLTTLSTEILCPYPKREKQHNFLITVTYQFDTFTNKINIKMFRKNMFLEISYIIHFNVYQSLSEIMDAFSANWELGDHSWYFRLILHFISNNLCSYSLFLIPDTNFFEENMINILEKF